MSGTFEGSYLGSDSKISTKAVMECKICWTPYDPAIGDETRQILPGTPFLALPSDWGCPNCDAPKEQFMVMDDPGADEGDGELDEERIKVAVDHLIADFEEVKNTSMKDMPLVNPALRVHAVGFKPWEGRAVGVLITPWFMNLVLLPGLAEDWSSLRPGTKQLFKFPSGAYEFIDMVMPRAGGLKSCSLFSPMAEFKTLTEAVDVATNVMTALFDEENREETDKAATIRKMREEELAPPTEEPDGEELGEEDLDAEPSVHARRAILTGHLSAASRAAEVSQPVGGDD